MTIRSPYIIAHRGFHLDRAENTVSAFKAAAELGCDGIELDVQLTLDGQPVVFHDPQIYIPQKGDLFKIRLLSFTELERISRELWGEPIPLLEEVLDRFVGRFKVINVELKRQINERENAKLLRQVQAILANYPLDSIIVSSFHPFLIKRMKEWNPELRTAFLIQPRTVITPFWRACLYLTRADFLHPRYDWFFAQYSLIPNDIPVS